MGDGREFRGINFGERRRVLPGRWFGAFKTDQSALRTQSHRFIKPQRRRVGFDDLEQHLLFAALLCLGDAMPHHLATYALAASAHRHAHRRHPARPSTARGT